MLIILHFISGVIGPSEDVQDLGLKILVVISAVGGQASW